MDAVVQLFQSVGVPVAFAVLFFIYWQRDREKWAKIIENNTNAIEKLVAIIKKGD